MLIAPRFFVFNPYTNSPNLFLNEAYSNVFDLIYRYKAEETGTSTRSIKMTIDEIEWNVDDATPNTSILSRSKLDKQSSKYASKKNRM